MCSPMPGLRCAMAALLFSTGIYAAPALAQESSDPIKLTLHDWTGQLITTELMGEVLKKKATASNTFRPTTSPNSPGLETGDLHVAMEMWETTGREAMDAATATGKARISARPA